MNDCLINMLKPKVKTEFARMCPLLPSPQSWEVVRAGESTYFRPSIEQDSILVSAPNLYVTKVNADAAGVIATMNTMLKEPVKDEEIKKEISLLLEFSRWHHQSERILDSVEI